MSMRAANQRIMAVLAKVQGWAGISQTPLSSYLESVSVSYQPLKALTVEEIRDWYRYTMGR